jgi:hypothetical protein
MCNLYNQWDATYTMFSIIISTLHVLSGISAHHQELIKLYVQPWVLSRFPAVYRWCGWDVPTCHMSYRFVHSFRAAGNAVPSWSCSTAVYKPVWHTRLLSVQWINSWWWTDELSETCRVSCQNKFVKLVHLVRFTKKKFVMMHGHTNVKLDKYILTNSMFWTATL